MTVIYSLKELNLAVKKQLGQLKQHEDLQRAEGEEALEHQDKESTRIGEKGFS